MHHKMGQHAVRSAWIRRAGRTARCGGRRDGLLSPRDRTPPCLVAASSNTTLPVLSAISSSMQHNACNAMKAKYSRVKKWSVTWLEFVA